MGVSVTFFFAFSGSSLGLDPRGLAVLATEPTSCVYVDGMAQWGRVQVSFTLSGEGEGREGKNQGFLCNSGGLNLPQCEP